jgi:nucleotide-binding universal stress UspA family protein
MSDLSTRASGRLRPGPASTPAVFERILTGYDGTERSAAAVRQAALLRPGSGRVLSVAVCDRRWWPLPEQARHMLAGLERSLGRPAWLETRVVEGSAAATLGQLADRLKATLLAVGAPRGGRLRSLVAADVATALLHQAPCSVLVARPRPGRRPATVVVGVDGSEHAFEALAVARALAGVLEAPLRPLVAGESAVAPGPELLALASEAEFDLRPAVETLVGAVGPDDLLVVGSRGLSGVPALGSVSERVAHDACCSVLVVRSRPDEPWPVAEERPRAGRPLRVADAMSRGVVCVPESRSVREAAALLLDGSAEVLAVTDGRGRPIGLLTAAGLPAVRVARVAETSLDWPQFLGEPVWSETELAAMYGAAGRRPVGEFVHRWAVEVREGDTIMRAAELLARHRLTHLPVVRGHRLVGTISAAALFRSAVHGAAPTRHPP